MTRRPLNPLITRRCHFSTSSLDIQLTHTAWCNKVHLYAAHIAWPVVTAVGPIPDVQLPQLLLLVLLSLHTD